MSVDLYIGKLADYVHKWANATFPDRLPKAALTKLVMSEVPELLVELQTKGPGPHLKGEWADCLILLLDLARIWDIEPAAAIMEKMEVNEGRTWVKDEELGHYQHEEGVVGFGGPEHSFTPALDQVARMVHPEPGCECLPGARWVMLTHLMRDDRVVNYCGCCSKRIYE